MSLKLTMLKGQSEHAKVGSGSTFRAWSLLVRPVRLRVCLTSSDARENPTVAALLRQVPGRPQPHLGPARSRRYLSPFSQKASPKRSR